MTPRYSIVTVSYNRADWLAEAIASVEAQTESDWEHLVHDNGSTDPKVADVLRAAKARNPDRFFFSQPGRRGPEAIGYYWNTLIGLSRGEFITVLDDDNRKRPDFLATMGACFLEDPVLDAITCGWVRVDAAGMPLGERHCNLDTTILNLARDNTIDSNSLLYRREVLDRVGLYDSSLSTNEDWHFNIRLVRACKVAHLPDALVDYREHGGMRSCDWQSLGAHENFRKIRAELFSEEERRAAEAIRSNIPIASGVM